jgi:hypothetical protein
MNRSRVLLLAILGCGETKPMPAPAKKDTPDASAALVPQQVQTSPTTKPAVVKEEPKAPEHFVAATAMAVPIFSEMEFPKEGSKKVARLGYIRMGGKAPAQKEPHAKSNCQEGWYELTAGGFVCGKYITTDLNHPRVRTAPHAPYTDKPLPYDYGYNVANGTPLYRVVPSREERLANEPWLAPKKRKEETSNDDLDAGAPVVAENESTPWYLREHDGGKPNITLDDLKGDGPIARRMVKGFFLSYDKVFISGGARWMRTSGLLIAPADRIMGWKMPTEYHGTWLDARADANTTQNATQSPDASTTESHKSPGAVGFVLNGKAKKYTIGAERKHASSGGDLNRFQVFRLTGEQASIGSNTYWETEEGWWLRSADAARTKPGPPPPELKAGEKWVDVSIGQQTLLAFEGDKPVYATLVSTGRTSPVKDKDHPTPTGVWRIREKHIASTMDGDVASDGPYSIEDVPWIMYFQGSYALHGAFWHANFGHKQSHGCVNLSPIDAKAIFGWTDPPLPDGWHGVNSTPENLGTWVSVHE